MLSAIDGSRRPRRPSSALEQHRAKRRSRPFRLADLGAWAARKSKNAAVAPLALFAGQVVPVVAAGETARGAVETALARLGERPHVSLLLNRPR